MYPGRTLAPQVLYPFIYRPRASCNQSIHYTQSIFPTWYHEFRLRPRLSSAAAATPPPGRSISAGGNALVACVAGRRCYGTAGTVHAKRTAREQWRPSATTLFVVTS